MATPKAAPKQAPQPNDIFILRFNTLCAPYNPGEVAGFTREKAAKLIQRGVAVIYRGGPTAPDSPDKTPEYARTFATVGAEELPGMSFDPLHAMQGAEKVMTDEQVEAELAKASGPQSGGPDDDK